MQIRIRYFAALKDRLGALVLRDVRSGTTAGGVWQAVLVEHPELARLPVRFVINERYVEAETRLEAGDELAIFPPVSGGVGGADVRGR